MSCKPYLAVIRTVALATASVAWQVQSWRYQAELATVATPHQAELDAKEEALQAMKDAARRQLLAQQAQQQEQTKRLSALDAKHHRELRHAQNEAAHLRADLDAGQRRLYVNTAPSTSSLSGNPVPGNASTAGLDDGADRVALHPAIAGRLVGITGDADACARKLIGLQAWITTHRADN